MSEPTEQPITYNRSVFFMFDLPSQISKADDSHALFLQRTGRRLSEVLI